MNILVRHLIFSKAFAAKRKSTSNEFLSIPIKKICRLCCNCVGGIPIFDHKTINISEEIKNIFDITIHRMNDCSNSICRACFRFLETCIKFKESCQRNQKSFNDYCNKLETQKRKRKKSTTPSDAKSENVSNDASPKNERSLSCDQNISSDGQIEEEFFIFTCKNCNATYSEQEALETHTRKCNRIFNSKKNKALSGESKRKFLCDTCGHLAHSNAGLLLHMTSHRNEFPYKCDICPYRSKTFDVLRVHKRSHLIDKPFKCSFCPKTTTTASNLKRHVMHVHSGLKPYKCNYCDKSFSSVGSVQRHTRDYHLQDNNKVDCEICLKTFNSRKIMRGHMVKIHKVKFSNRGRLPAYLKHEIAENSVTE